jgi:hypothetical protein
MTLEFSYHAQRFTARNLWLTRLFIEREFGIVPAKTVLSGCCTGAASAGFAFNASGFGGHAARVRRRANRLGEFLCKMLPSFFSPTTLSIPSKRTVPRRGISAFA